MVIVDTLSAFRRPHGLVDVSSATVDLVDSRSGLLITSIILIVLQRRLMPQARAVLANATPNKIFQPVARTES